MTGPLAAREGTVVRSTFTRNVGVRANWLAECRFSVDHQFEADVQTTLQRLMSESPPNSNLLARGFGIN